MKWNSVIKKLYQKDLVIGIVFIFIFLFIQEGIVFCALNKSESKIAQGRIIEKTEIGKEKVETLAKDVERLRAELLEGIILASSKNIETSNCLIKWIGVVSTIFAIIIALAGMFIALEGNRSRKRREEALKILENAKTYAEENIKEFGKAMKSLDDKLKEFDETIKVKITEIDKLCNEFVNVSLEQLSKDTEEMAKTIRERGEKGVKTEAEEKIEKATEQLKFLERRIKFFEEIGMPNDPKVLFSKAMVFKEKKAYPECLELLQNAIIADPKFDNAYYHAGFVQLMLGDNEGAVKTYDKYLELKPLEAGAYNNKGVALQRTGKNEEALKCYEKALEIQPDVELYKNNLEQIRKVLKKD